MTEETKEYVVTRPNTAGLRANGSNKSVPDLKVGDTINLTDKQAAFRINKVRLKDESVALSKAGAKSKLEKENIELKQRVSELEERTAELEATAKALHEENVKLKGAA